MVGTGPTGVRAISGAPVSLCDGLQRGALHSLRPRSAVGRGTGMAGGVPLSITHTHTHTHTHNHSARVPCTHHALKSQETNRHQHGRCSSHLGSSGPHCEWLLPISNDWQASHRASVTGTRSGEAGCQAAGRHKCLGFFSWSSRTPGPNYPARHATLPTWPISGSSCLWGRLRACLCVHTVALVSGHTARWPRPGPA